MKKSRKVILSLVLVLVLNSILVIKPIAAETHGAWMSSRVIGELVYQPKWTNFTSINASLYSASRTLYSKVTVKTNSMASFYGTVYLESYRGSGWTIERSWSMSGSGAGILNQQTSGISGVSYRLRVVVTSGSETVTVYSNTTSA